MKRRRTKAEIDKDHIDDLLKRKPNLILFPNHYNFRKRVLRYWNSTMLGTAIKDGEGWYVQKATKRR